MSAGKLTCIPTIDEHVLLCKDDEMVAIVGVNKDQGGSQLLFKESFQDMKFGFTTDDFMTDFNKEMKEKGKEDQSLIRFYAKMPESGKFKQMVDIGIKRSRLDDILSFVPEPVEKFQLDDSNFGKLEL